MSSVDCGSEMENPQSINLLSLQYAPRPRRWQRYVRRSVSCVIVLTVIVAAWRTSGRVYEQGTTLAAQARIAQFSIPPGMLVFSTCPADCAQLIGSASYVPTDIPHEGRRPDRLGPEVGYCPAVPLLKKSPFASYGTVFGNPMLFLHSRRTPAGRRRIVYVSLSLGACRLPPSHVRENVFGDVTEFASCYGGYSPEFLQIWIDTFLYIPADLQPGSRPVRIYFDGSGQQRYHRYRRPEEQFPASAFILPQRLTSSGRADFGPHVGNALFRVFAGQPDDSDETKINIPYEIEGEHGLLVGQLQDSGDVTWEAVHGSLKSWPSKVIKGDKDM